MYFFRIAGVAKVRCLHSEEVRRSRREQSEGLHGNSILEDVSGCIRHRARIHWRKSQVS